MGSVFERWRRAPPVLTVETVWTEHRQFIHDWLRCRGIREQDRGDVASDIKITLVRRLHDYDPSRGELRAWIYGILDRHVKRYIQRRAKAVQPRCEDGPVTELVSSENDLINRLFLETLLCQIEPEKRRLVFIAFAIQGMTDREISEAFSMPEGTVKTWILRTREELAKAYGRHQAEQARLGVLLPLGFAELLSRARVAAVWVPDAMHAEPPRDSFDDGDSIDQEAPQTSSWSARNGLDVPAIPGEIGPLAVGLVAGAAIMFALMRAPARPVEPIEPETLPVLVTPRLAVVEPIPAGPIRALPEPPAPPAGGARPISGKASVPASRMSVEGSHDGAGHEQALIRGMAEEFARGDFGPLLVLINHHATEFPNSTFASERERIRAVLPGQSPASPNQPFASILK